MHEWRYARDMYEAYQSKQLAEQVKQEVIDLKDELQTVKEEKSENPSREWIYEQSMDKASPAEKLGIKRLLQKRKSKQKCVLEQMRDAER